MIRVHPGAALYHLHKGQRTGTAPFSLQVPQVHFVEVPGLLAYSRVAMY